MAGFTQHVKPQGNLTNVKICQLLHDVQMQLFKALTDLAKHVVQTAASSISQSDLESKAQGNNCCCQLSS